MNRKRIALTVMVDLDPIPGWGDKPADWERWLEGHLLSTVGHYNPVVVLNEPEQEARDA